MNKVSDPFQFAKQIQVFEYWKRLNSSDFTVSFFSHKDCRVAIAESKSPQLRIQPRHKSGGPSRATEANVEITAYHVWIRQRLNDQICAVFRHDRVRMQKPENVT